MHRFSLIAVWILSLALVGRAVAEAPSLDDLRKSGVVAERYDGVLVIRKESGDAALRALVDSVNAKRREIYEAQAKKQGVPKEEVGKVYALEIAAKAPPGTWFLGEDGKWVQKK
jgi:hypothetical protein